VKPVEVFVPIPGGSSGSARVVGQAAGWRYGAVMLLQQPLSDGSILNAVLFWDEERDLMGAVSATLRLADGREEILDPYLHIEIVHSEFTGILLKLRPEP
jgi:hypothetical protein